MELQMLAPSEYVRIQDDPTRYYRVPLLGWIYRRRVARCISLLPEGGRVLEIGYGSGVSFLNLSRKFPEIHGIDLHTHADEVAHSFAHTHSNLHLRQGDVRALPYEDGSFDAAIAVSIHEHLPPDTQDEAFAEIRRVLVPGGCYVVGVPGVNAMMTAAFYALGWDIRPYHISKETRVLEAMRRVLAMDVTRYWPTSWLKSQTAYVCARAWKH